MDPANVYGEWIEIGAPIYNTEVLDFRPQGVYRNNRLVSTTYSFNGKQITIITGNGEVTYEFAGTDSSPQIKRTGTNAPPQRFIKKGYEDTVKQTSSGTGSEARRAALAEHFK